MSCKRWTRKTSEANEKYDKHSYTQQNSSCLYYHGYYHNIFSEIQSSIHSSTYTYDRWSHIVLINTWLTLRFSVTFGSKLVYILERAFHELWTRVRRSDYIRELLGKLLTRVVCPPLNEAYNLLRVNRSWYFQSTQDSTSCVQL